MIQAAVALTTRRSLVTGGVATVASATGVQLALASDDPSGLTAHEREIAALQPEMAGLTLEELLTFYDACETARNALLGVQNQPRCRHSPDVFTLVEERIDRFHYAMIAVAKEAKRREPSGQLEREVKTAILARWAIECGSWGDLAAAATIAAFPVPLPQ